MKPRKKAQQSNGYAQAKRVMDDFRKQRGMISELARRLNVKRQSVHDWEVVPLTRVAEISHITKMTREELRPDFFE